MVVGTDEYCDGIGPLHLPVPPDPAAAMLPRPGGGGGGGPSAEALQAEWVCKHARKLQARVYEVPSEIEDQVCRLKLKAMGIAIDTLTPEQVAYLASSGEGT